MIDSGAFLTLAEVAIALAGFAGVAFALVHGREELHPADHARLFNALTPSLSAAFLALVPVGLDLLEVPAKTLWPATALIYAVMMFAIVPATILMMRRVPPEARVTMSRPVAFASQSSVLTAAVLGLLNAMTPWPGLAPEGFYFCTVVLILVVSAVVFIRVLFVRPVR